MEWKDVTTYSRGQKERTPTAWQISSGTPRVYITNDHLHYKGLWIMHCFKVGIDTKQIAADNLEDAKAMALKKVYEAIGQINSDYMGLVK